MSRLLLVRHGETDWNVDNRYQGQSDIPLNARGRAQAAAIGRRLSSEKLDVIYASDLQRALHTAEAIAAHHPIGVQPDARLREILIGEWEGLTYAEMQARDLEGLARWIETPEEVSAPGGETLVELASRMREVLEEMRARPDGETIVLASHGGALNAFLCLALGIPTSRWRMRLDSASLSELHLYPEGATLVHLNDCHHLDGLTP